MKNIKTYKKFNEEISKKGVLTAALAGTLAVSGGLTGYMNHETDKMKQSWESKVEAKRKCAIFAHPDDEFNILTVLDSSIDVFYLTAGEEGWRHSHEYGNPEDVKKDIVSIRRKEAKDISKYFGFKHSIFNFPDVNNQSQVEWDNNRVKTLIENISNDYDEVYTIGPIGREHHQHMQIALMLKEICPEKTVYGNWYRVSPSETGITDYKDCPFVEKDLHFFVDALKSQGTMKGTRDFKGHILWTP